MLRVLGRGRSWRGRRRRRERLFLERARHGRDGRLDRREIRRENLRREKVLKADAVERRGILDRRRGHRLYAGDVSIEEGAYDEPDAGGGPQAPVGSAEHFGHRSHHGFVDPRSENVHRLFRAEKLMDKDPCSVIGVRLFPKVEDDSENSRSRAFKGRHLFEGGRHRICGQRHRCAQKARFSAKIIGDEARVDPRFFGDASHGHRIEFAGGELFAGNFHEARSYLSAHSSRSSSYPPCHTFTLRRIFTKSEGR